MNAKERLVPRLVAAGEDALLSGDFEKAWWALDTALCLDPSSRPRLWQRGLCCYYTGRYLEGMLQFEADMNENGSDVEEIIWHFLCRCKEFGYPAAREKGFLTLRESMDGPIPPMPEVLKLFQGEIEVEEVIGAAAGPDEKGLKSYNGTNALAYAHFYVGLHYQIQGHFSEAGHHFKQASSFHNPDFMGKLMEMHQRLFVRTDSQKSILPHFIVGSPSSARSCSSIICGGWQLSNGHSITQISIVDCVMGLLQAFDAGVTAFDCGDIYTGVEEIYGKALAAHVERGGSRRDIAIHTKLVPDLDVIRAGRVDEKYVRGVIRRSLNRLGTSYLDLVQFHWWDYAVSGYIEAVGVLLKMMREGLVKEIGLTNFDREHTHSLLSAGIPVSTTQVQLSLIDRRPVTSGLLDLCSKHGVSVLAYGVLAGGFLTNQWLGKALLDQLPSRSHVKYQLIIDEFGGWILFQELLEVLRNIAAEIPPITINQDAISITIAMVAIAYVLNLPAVGGVILGSLDPWHIKEAIAATHLKLTSAQLARIGTVLDKSVGPVGEVYGIERLSTGKHARIMHYNLNQLHQPSHLEELCRRFLDLLFSAYPSEATRTGYQVPLSKNSVGLSPLTKSTPSAKAGPVFSFEKYALLAIRACTFNHHLNISSATEIERHCERVRSLLQEVENIETSSLDDEQNVDHQLLTAQLNLELVKWEEVRMQEKDPAFYLPFEPLNYLMPCWGLRNVADKDSVRNGGVVEYPEGVPHPGVVELSKSTRLMALLSRLRLLPQTLKNCKANLCSYVRVFTERAVSISIHFEEFLYSSVPSQMETQLADCTGCGQEAKMVQEIVQEIVLAAEAATMAVSHFRIFLQNHVLPKSEDSVAVGKEVYSKLLHYGHFIDDSSELLAVGEKHFAAVTQQLEKLASEIHPSLTWKEITDTIIRCMHPSSQDLLSAYMQEIHRAREHMTHCNVIPALPRDEEVIGIHTPQFLVPFSPFGDFLNPVPFASSGNNHLHGYLMLHSISSLDLTPAEEERLLQAHDFTWISVIAPHECYPGHHTQALLAQQHPRILRKYYESALFYEGWGLYCEELAYETGFFRKEVASQPKCASLFASINLAPVSADDFSELARLTQLRLRLWRAARMILDICLHNGEMSFDECQRFLVDRVMFNQSSASREVLMYASRPTYAACYCAGYLCLMDLRRKKCAESGKDFSLKDFHSTILSKGCLPFSLLKQLL